MRNPPLNGSLEKFSMGSILKINFYFSLVSCGTQIADSFHCCCPFGMKR